MIQRKSLTCWAWQQWVRWIITCICYIQQIIMLTRDEMAAHRLPTGCKLSLQGNGNIESGIHIQIKSSLLSYWFEVKYTAITSATHCSMSHQTNPVWHNAKYRIRITKLECSDSTHRDISTEAFADKHKLLPVWQCEQETPMGLRAPNLKNTSIHTTINESDTPVALVQKMCLTEEP